MNIKEESSTNVHMGGTKDNQYKGVFHKSSLNGKKVQAALAMAISLWIGGSVAEAASVSYIYLDINNNDQLHNDVSEQVTPVQNGKKLTITGVNLPGNLLVFGGYANSNNDAIGYTLELNNVTGDGIGKIYGGDN